MIHRKTSRLPAREASCAALLFALIACDQTGAVLFSQGIGGGGTSSNGSSTTGAGGQPPMTFLDALAVGPYHACLLAGGNDLGQPAIGAEWLEIRIGPQHLGSPPQPAIQS